MSLQEKMLKAIQSVEKKFKEGDRVLFDNGLANFFSQGETCRVYKVKSVNFLSYDLVLDIPIEDLNYAKKIISECSESVFDSYGNPFDRIKDNIPYSSAELNKALNIEKDLFLYQITEDRLKFAE